MSAGAPVDQREPGRLCYCDGNQVWWRESPGNDVVVESPSRRGVCGRVNRGLHGYFNEVIKKMGLVVIGCCLMTAACSGSGEQDSVKAAAQHFIDDTISGDAVSACRELAPRARDSLARGGDSCEGALPSVRLPGDPVGTVAVWSDEAQVKTAGDTVFLHDFSTGWLVTGAGCRPENEQVYRCEVGGP